MPVIGVAIAIPEPYGRELQAARARFGDPLATAIPTHVTLLPPTEVHPDDIAKADCHLEDIAASCRPFEMRLRGTGTFRPVSPVVFVKVVSGVAECERIEASVRSGPLSRDLAFPYHPHVTLAHDVDTRSLDEAGAEMAGYDVVFTVSSFSRYRHGADRVWRPEQAYPFPG